MSDIDCTIENNNDNIMHNTLSPFITSNKHNKFFSFADTITDNIADDDTVNDKFDAFVKQLDIINIGIDDDTPDDTEKKPTEIQTIVGHLTVLSKSMLSKSMLSKSIIDQPFSLEEPQDFSLPFDNHIHTETTDHFKQKHNNSNWCTFCFNNKFITRTSCIKFIDKCILKFNMNKVKFVDNLNKDKHMLTSILCLDHYASEYLKDANKELYDILSSDIRFVSGDNSEFITNGIIIQYNERQYIRNTKDHTTYNEWLISNNFRCENCKGLSCPFHHDFGSWDTITDDVSDKKKYCCGWCIDFFDKLDEMSFASLDQNQEDKPLIEHSDYMFNPLCI